VKAKEIQELIDFIAKSGLDEVNIETDQFKISVKRNSGVAGKLAEPTVHTLMSVPSQLVASAQSTTPITPAQPATAPSADDSSAPKASSYITVKSPMIGTFYRSSNPDSPVFVSVGDDVKKGQVVCIIEAMKLFNEIESEVSGRIVKVLVENASPVEYDQPLFLVDPS
jgi:acetyl-CoA carboxylase biotin carboxyl carrier protein